MNKRSILTAVLALGLGVTALTGCSDNTGANYVTPSNVETIQNTIAEIGDQGVKVPEKRDLKVTLPESDKAADYKVEVSDPETLSVGKPEKNVITLHPPQGDRRGRGPRHRHRHRQGRHHHRLQGDRDRGRQLIWHY